ncbi:MAG: hypothetical protein KDH97_25355, partial [Calditrichaeota bacterium]|nr:hypothetical protein [Calditrichota bacterium]
ARINMVSGRKARDFVEKWMGEARRAKSEERRAKSEARRAKSEERRAKSVMESKYFQTQPKINYPISVV